MRAETSRVMHRLALTTLPLLHHQVSRYTANIELIVAMSLVALVVLAFVWRR